jgi:hypothetical protein
MLAGFHQIVVFVNSTIHIKVNQNNKICDYDAFHDYSI